VPLSQLAHGRSVSNNLESHVRLLGILHGSQSSVRKYTSDNHTPVLDLVTNADDLVGFVASLVQS
jgi:hypothetical protein